MDRKYIFRYITPVCIESVRIFFCISETTTNNIHELNHNVFSASIDPGLVSYNYVI